jgi:two-component system cell cycle sensor histidine kinase/response regulator CckA
MLITNFRLPGEFHSIFEKKNRPGCNMVSESTSLPTILIVDDEKPVRDIVRAWLASAGYPVLEAQDGKTALQLITQRSLQIGLLVTDVIMPQMNGRELADRVSWIRPHLRVLFISAYSSDILIGLGLCPDGVDLLRKPFDKAKLIGQVQRILTVSRTWRELNAKSA